MPVLMSAAHHEARCGYRCADRAVIDQLPAGLDAAAEERLRRAGNAQPFRRASSSTCLPSSRVTASGFSTYTCLPASSACRQTAHALSGIVRLTTISISGSANSCSTVYAFARRKLLRALLSREQDRYLQQRQAQPRDISSRFVK